MLSLVLGSSTYSFALMLTLFIAGISIGSAVAERLLRRGVDPYRTYGYSLAIAGDAAKEFRHHPFNVGTFGDAVAMTAVSAGDVIVRAQLGADSRGGRLFANVKVQCAPHLSVPKCLLRRLLETANSHHGSVNPEKPLARWKRRSVLRIRS